MNRLHRTIIALAIAVGGVLLTVTIAVGIQTNGEQEPKPRPCAVTQSDGAERQHLSLRWNPASIDQRLLVGESITVSASFTSSKPLTDIQLEPCFDSELEHSIRISPNNFRKAPQGQALSFDVVIALSQAAPTGTFEGGIKLRTADGLIEILPVVVNVGLTCPDISPDPTSQPRRLCPSPHAISVRALLACPDKYAGKSLTAFGYYYASTEKVVLAAGTGGHGRWAASRDYRMWAGWDVALPEDFHAQLTELPGIGESDYIGAVQVKGIFRARQDHGYGHMGTYDHSFLIQDARVCNRVQQEEDEL